MKKKTLVVSIVCILSILCSSLIACDTHVHQFEKEWTYDAEYHWHIAACEHEEEISGKAAHDFRENGICKTCQYKRVDGGNGNIDLPTKDFSSELLREVPAPNTAQAVTENGVNYVLLSNGTYEVAGFQGNGVSDLVIPEQINGADVTAIGEMAFLENTTLRTVTLNNKITILRRGAFADCTNLTSITGLSGLKTLGSYAFQGCSKITSFDLPTGLKKIEECAFYGCTGITEIVLPSTVEIIGDYAFYQCANLASVSLPDSLIYLSCAFAECDSLTDIVIPDSVRKIEYQGMFYGCENIENITIPFIGYDRDKSFPLGFLFDLNASTANLPITNLTVPASLKSVTITDCTQLGDYAFSGLSQLESVVINEEVTHIGNSAFVGCTGLTYTVERNGNYLGTQANPYMILASVVDKTVTSFTINSRTKHIAGSAFAGCAALSSMSVPAGIESVGANAFADCANLSFYTKNNTRYLGNSENQCMILVRCTSPSTSFNFESGTTVIAGGAFKNCENLQSINIPDRIKAIGGETFMGCSKLTNIVIPANVTIGTNAFINCPQITNVTAPAAALNNTIYETEDPPLQYLKTVEFVSGEFVATDPFYECPALEKVTLPETIIRIYDYAFYNCAALTEINLPDAVEYIGGYAFYGCESLKEFKMPDNLKTVGQYAFYKCSSFGGQLILPEGLETIDDGAFEQTAITDLYIGASLEFFGPRTFGLLEHLVNVMVSADNTAYYSVGNCIIELNSGILRVGTSSSVLPQGEGNPIVTAIGDTAFYGRMELVTINIPKSVTSFGENAFFSCAHLNEINYEGTLEEWEAITKPSTWTKEVATAYEGKEIIVHCSDGDKTEIGSKSTSLG